MENEAGIPKTGKGKKQTNAALRDTVLASSLHWCLARNNTGNGQDSESLF